MSTEKTFEIYKITNLVNGKIYVGATMDGIGKRWARHLTKTNAGATTPICNAIREFGAENFSITLVELCENEGHMNEREAYWIATLSATNSNIGYNAKVGGGVRHQSDITKAKIGNLHRGKVSKYRKPILQYDSDGNLVKEYVSLSEAIELTGIAKTSIVRVLNKEATRFSKKNPYVWIYKIDEEIPLRIDPKDYYRDLDYKVVPSEAFNNRRASYLVDNQDVVKFAKPVEQYDLQGNKLNSFRSIAEAAKVTGISGATIKAYANDPEYINRVPINRRQFNWKYGEYTEDNKINQTEVLAKAAEKNTIVIIASTTPNGEPVEEFKGIVNLGKLWGADPKTIRKRIRDGKPIRGLYLRIKE